MSPRPASDGIPVVLADCDRHGMTEHAEHRAGTSRAGLERRRTRCRTCHAEQALASYHRSKEPRP